MARVPVQIAIQGGGAGIYALIAAAEVLFEAHKNKLIEIKRLAGTSAGAIVSVMYAAGIRRDHIISVLSQNPTKYAHLFGSLFTDSRQSIAFRALKLFLRCTRHHDVIPYLPIFRTVLDDRPLLENGELCLFLGDLLSKLGFSSPYFGALKPPVVVALTSLSGRNEHFLYSRSDKGFPIIDAMVYSANIPFIFYGYKTMARYHPFVDGGLVCNLPFEILRGDGRLARDDDLDHLPIICVLLEKTSMPFQPSDTLQALGESIISAVVGTAISRATQDETIYKITVSPGDVGLLDFETCRNILVDDKFERFESVMKQTSNQLDDILRNLHRRELQVRQFGIASRALPPRMEYKTTPRPSCYFFAQRYLGIQEEEESQKVILKALKDDIIPDWEIKEIGTESVSRERFDAFTRPELAMSNEAIYAFPFFLSYLRKMAWGVIPYGEHKLVGILRKKCSKKFDFIASAKINDISDARRQRELLDNIFVNLGDDGHLYASKGYMFNEILGLMVGRYVSEMWQIKFLKRCKPHEPIEEDGKFKLESVIVNEVASDISLVLVDLADEREMIDSFPDEIREKVEIVNVMHGLDILVGIGFSLPMAQRLLENGKDWKRLQSIAFRCLQPATDRIEKAGIKLFEDMPDEPA